MNIFRPLRADEIDIRVATVSDKGCSLLLYKDARCDQNILDETVGPMNWQRHHFRDNANCIVSIWDKGKNQWIEKEDTGTESYTEKEKGLASDSFKRACFNWGIGRELYTAPFIWVSAGNVNLKDKPSGGKTTNDRFTVSEIDYKDGVITALEVKNASMKNKIVFAFGNTKGQVEDDKKTAETAEMTIGTAKMEVVSQKAKEAGVSMDQVLKKFKIKSIGLMTESQFVDCMAMLQKQIDIKEEKNEG